MGLPPSAVPDDFNQQIILKNLLVWQACPSGFFCPQALTEPIACPASRPWSAPGSSVASNCTCLRGTFFNSTSQACQECRAFSACSTGQYMAGWTLCMLADGASNGGTCMPCQNSATNATYTSGPGVEAMTSNGGYTGICSFICPYGTTLDGSGGCLSPYTCTPIAGPILQSLSQKLVYSSHLANLHDTLAVIRDSQRFSSICEMQRELSQAIYTIANSGSNIVWPQVSTSCTAAMISAHTACNAPTICFVTANATFASDYVCAPCPLPPTNGYYSISTLAFSCKISCSGGFYFNASSGNCSSCAALEAKHCGTGYFIRGQGCYGDLTPFPTLDPYKLSISNCVLCNKPQPSPGSNQWLWLSDSNGCSYQRCSELSGVGTTIYIVSDCKNTSDFITASCITKCEPGFWMKGTCSPKTTGVCTICTTKNPGYFLIAACSEHADSIWRECGVSQQGVFAPGFYCIGDGQQQVCPNNKTSQRLASSKGGDCFCPAGTASAADSTCSPANCLQDTSTSFLAPGAGGVSVSYMFTNAQQHTECAICGLNTTTPNPLSSSSTLARSKGDGIGLTSCVCPAGTYAEISDTHITACNPCPISSYLNPSVCAGGGNYVGIPETCIAREGNIGPPQCQCIPPPFTTLVEGGVGVALSTCTIQNPSLCKQGFDLIQVSGQKPTPPAEIPTGSALYISRSQSLQGWNTFHKPSSLDISFNYEIKRMAATSDLDSWSVFFNL